MKAVDTNVLAHFLFTDHPEHHDRARSLLYRAASGEFELFVPASTLNELSWILVTKRRVPRTKAADVFRDLVSLEGLVVENAEIVGKAIDIWSRTGQVSYVDCYILTLVSHLGMSEIYTFDKGMGRYPGVERIEP